MASASVSELIIFIAALSVAAAVSGVLVTTVGDISGSLDEQGADVAASIDTDVEIISDPASGAVYDNSDGEITVLVKNTGRRTLSTTDSSVELLVNGRYVTPSEYTVTVLDGEQWREGGVVRIKINRSQTLTSGDHRVTVIVGDEQEVLRFRV